MEVGVRLLMVTTQHRGEPAIEWVKVAKVGRKWATLVAEDSGRDRGRCEIEDLCYDSGGYGNRVTLYGSRDEYEQSLEETRLWREIGNVARGYGRPKHLTLEDLRTVAGILSTPTTKPRSAE